MPVTAIDPNAALIVIDLQQGTLVIPAVHPIAEIVARAALADTFRSLCLPAVLVNVTGGAPGRTEQPHGGGERPAGWADLLPEMNRRPGDHVVTKRTWGAFTNTGLADYLVGLGVTQVVIAGVATSLSVESTARQAHEAGFNVTLAVDAMTDRSADAHANSITRIFPRLGETGTAQEIIDLLGSTRAR